MDTSNRSKLVKALAEEMNIFDPFDTRLSGVARYDSNTGTLYCDGITLPHSTLQDIKKWHYEQMISYKKQADKDPTKTDLYMRFAVAYNAINMLEDNVGDIVNVHSSRNVDKDT